MINQKTGWILLFVIVMIFPARAYASSEVFHDVGEEHDYYEEIMYLSERGIIEGFPDGSFQPSGPLTRGQTAIMLARLLDLEVESTKSPFRDVKSTSASFPKIMAAYEHGIIRGYQDNTFRQHEEISRMHVALLLDNTFNYPEGGTSPFNDVPDSHMYAGEITAMYDAGITTGYKDGRFRPEQTINRGQFSALLYRTIQWKEQEQDRLIQEEVRRTEELLNQLSSPIQVSDLQDADEVVSAQIDLMRKYEFTLDQQEKFETLVDEIKTIRREHASPGFTKLLEDFNDDTIRSKTFEYERNFSQNDYQGAATDMEEPFTYLEGDSNVLVVAPHTTWHLRNGEKKPPEVYTGAMTLLLHEYAGVHVIFTNQQTNDPAYSDDVPLKYEVRRLLETETIDTVLDLHGANRNRPFDVDLGTANGELLSNEKTNAYRSIFYAEGLMDVRENDTFTAINPATTANYAVRHGAKSAAQIEINRDFRDPVQGFESYQQTLSALYLVVKESENYSK